MYHYVDFFYAFALRLNKGSVFNVLKQPLATTKNAYSHVLLLKHNPFQDLDVFSVRLHGNKHGQSVLMQSADNYT